MEGLKLKELKEHVKKFNGVSIHGNQIRINFYYRGVRCIEPLKGLTLTKSNLKFASNKRVSILHEIATSTFDYLKNFPSSKKANLFIPHIKEVPYVKDAIDKWLNIKEKNSAYSTQLTYRSKSKTHIVPKWGEYRLNEITQSDIKHWSSMELSNLANKTINEIMIPFRGIFQDAVADRLIDHNPLEFINNLEVIVDAPDPFTQKEITKIINCPTSRQQEINAFVFCCWTGLRMSELISLAWEDVDFAKGVVKVKRAKVKGRFKCPKTKGSTRTIELLAPALKALKRQFSLSGKFKAKEIEVTQVDNKTVRKESIKFVFLNSRSNTPHSSEGTFRDRFFKVHLQNSNVRYRGPGQARHTFASQLLTAGVNERWIMKQMGHTSIKMIEKHYGKWMDEEMPDMAKKVNLLLGF